MGDELTAAIRRMLPDSRAGDVRKGSITTRFGEAHRIYCASCAKWCGFCYADTTAMFYLCDDCDKYGCGLDLPVVNPDELKAGT